MGDESIRRSSGKRSVEGLEKVSGSLWRRRLVVSSASSSGHWNMRGAEEEEMFAMGIVLGILALSMGKLRGSKFPEQGKVLSQLGFCLALREGQEELVALSLEIFLRGLSTQDIKKISKHIYGENYSPSLVSRFNKELGEALSLWLNRPIEKRIKYLYLDGVKSILKKR